MEDGGRKDGTPQTTKRFAVMIEHTKARENPRPAINSVIDNHQVISEVHIVGVGRPWGGAKPPYAEWTTDASVLKERGIAVHFHVENPFVRGRKRGNGVRCNAFYLMDIPSRATISTVAMRKMTSKIDSDGLTKHFWSMSTITTPHDHDQRRVLSPWVPFIMLLLFVNWLRGLGTRWFRTQDGQNIRVWRMVNKEKWSEPEPEAWTWMLIPWTFPDRATTIYVTEGAEVLLEEGWRGFLWMCRRQQNVGLRSVLIVPFILAFLGAPFWRLLGWLEVTMWFQRTSWVLITVDLMIALYVSAKYSNVTAAMVRVVALPFIAFPAFPLAYLQGRYLSRGK